MAPTDVNVWSQPAVGKFGVSRANPKGRIGSKWLESIQAELDEIDSVLGKDAKKVTDSASQSKKTSPADSRTASPPRSPVPAPLSFGRRHNGKRSPSPKARGQVHGNTSGKLRGVIVSRSQSPDRHDAVRPDSPGSQNWRQKQVAAHRENSMRRAAASPDSRKSATNKSRNRKLQRDTSRSSSPQPSQSASKNARVAPIDERDRISEQAIKDLAEIKKKLKETILGSLRPMSPSGRYPRSLSPTRRRRRLPDVLGSTMHQCIASNWGSLTDSQRPDPSPHQVTQSAVPFYAPQEAWKSAHERYSCSLWSREQTIRTAPEQWRQPTQNRFEWRLDGRRARSSSQRSQSRSKSPRAPEEEVLSMSIIGNNMEVVEPKNWKHFEGGRFSKSSRQTSEWLFRGIDKQLSLMLDSNDRLSARGEETQRAESAYAGAQAK